MTPKGGTHLSRHVDALLEEHLAAAGASQTPSLRPRGAGDETDPGKALELARKALRAVVKDRRLAADLRVAWLNHATGSGFGTVPPPRSSRALADADVVRGDPDYPIAWVAAEDHEVICSANGHAFAIAANPKILKLLERLNTGIPSSVERLVEAYAGSVKVAETAFEATPAEIRSPLERLHALRAISEGPSRLSGAEGGARRSRSGRGAG